MAHHWSNKDIIERRMMLILKSLYQRLHHCSDSRHLFIAGMQRSGTNMLMDVLERSFETDVFHEHDPRAFHDYEQRAPAILHDLAERSHAPLVIFKALLESDLLPQLLDEFASAKAIWSVRDYRDVVNSAKRSFPHLQRTITRMVTQPGDYWQSRGALPPIFETLKRLYRPDLSLNASAALFWYARNALYFELNMADDERIMLVRYEDLVSEPLEQFRRVFEFAELPLHRWATAKVHSRSIARHNAPDLPEDIEALCESTYERFQNESPH
jgi:hypothetical protein